LPVSRRIRRAFVYASGFSFVSAVGVAIYTVSTIDSQPREFSSFAPLVVPSVPCLIEPLPPIRDAVALAFENGLAGSAGAVDVSDLTLATARALTRFEKVLTSAGATLTVTSAYRPAAYQKHLQAVWDKWMRELRNNVDPACVQLRAEVGREFTHHHLLETQRPATSSDHTRGLAFDATVELPDLKPSRRRRFSLDRLARSCKLRRPNLRYDPVHYRLVG
jgi:hypothetical protein